ncbi:hypothetical protein IG631_01287 [Alternaria alternata]|nr:hypothetical protein IG631_01287 [Alternaria alternata]
MMKDQRIKAQQLTRAGIQVGRQVLVGTVRSEPSWGEMWSCWGSGRSHGRAGVMRLGLKYWRNG